MKKSILRVSMMLMMASVTLTSCQEFWDDLFGVESTPSTPSTPSEPDEPKDDKVVTEATVEDLADITAALNDAKDEIEAAAKSGGEYEIAIKSEEGLETTTSDNTIEVPRVEDSNINLNFTNGVSTEQTLTVKAADAKSETPTEAVNKLTITMPESKGLNLELDMPETTVTLKAASGTVTYEEVVATTALNTLYIEKGVTVKNLQVKGGSVVVNGGTAETLIIADEINDDDILRVYADSITIGNLWTPEQPTIVQHALIKGYHIKNLKVIKDANIGLYAWNNPTERLMIAEGVVVKHFGNEPCVRIIEGEGEGAEFSVEWDPAPHLHSVEEVKGITLSGFPNNTLINMIRGNFENCIFTSTKVEFQPVTAIGNTVKDCKFEGTTISFAVPRQDGDIPSCKFSFTGCDFSQGFNLETSLIDWDYMYDENGEMIWEHIDWYYVDSTDGYTHYVQDKSEIPTDAIRWGERGEYKKTDAKYEDYDVVIILDKCTMGGNSLPAPEKFIIKPEKIPAGVNLKYVIDGTTYQFVEDSLEIVQ